MTTPPLNTEAEAMALEKVRAIYDASRNAPRGTMTAATRAMLRWVLEDAGVELGAYDERIAEWAGAWEPHVVGVVCGWIGRAHEAAAVLRDPDPDGITLVKPEDAPRRLMLNLGPGARIELGRDPARDAEAMARLSAVALYAAGELRAMRGDGNG